jgi:hypothetical protein
VIGRESVFTTIRNDGISRSVRSAIAVSISRRPPGTKYAAPAHVTVRISETAIRLIGSQGVSPQRTLLIQRLSPANSTAGASIPLNSRVPELHVNRPYVVGIAYLKFCLSVFKSYCAGFTDLRTNELVSSSFSKHFRPGHGFDHRATAFGKAKQHVSAGKSVRAVKPSGSPIFQRRRVRLPAETSKGASMWCIVQP